MEKILIAIKDDFQNRVYLDFFREEGFEPLTAQSCQEIQDKVFQDHPDIILLDILYAEEDNYQLLEKIKSDQLTQKTPIILFSRTQKENYLDKAVEFEVKDFVIGAYNSPINVLSKIKIHLGKEKSYSLKVDYSLEDVKEIVKDLGYNPEGKCHKCSKPLEMVLLRDLSKGENYFKVSFVCPVCQI
jgi:PleD family two-component response regulator